VRALIAPGTVPAMLREIYVGRRTGMLRFAHGAEYCSLRFVNGHIVFGAASEKRLHMGEVMVAQGLLSREHLEMATHRVLAERMRLGESLIALGVVDHELLEEFLGFHVRQILVEVFSWREGEVSFEEQDPKTRLEHDFPLKTSTGEMIVDAVRQIEDQDQIRFGLGDLDRVLLASTEPLVRFQRVTLTPVDGFVLSRVDGTLSAREVMEITPLDRAAVEASLFALLCTGILEYAPEPPKAQPPATPQFLRQEIFEAYHALGEKNHFQVLGVDEDDASDPQIKAAFLRMAKRYHPDAHHDPALRDMRDKLEALFFRVSEAHRVLSDPRSRQAYLDHLRGPARASRPAPKGQPAAVVVQAVNAVQAESLVQTAEDHFQEGRYWEAVALLSEVVKVASGRLLARARLLLARAYLTHPNTEKEAEKQLLAVHHDEPDNLDAYLLLGTVYKRMGRKTRAISMFRKVLEKRPSHREAIAELETLEPKPASPPAEAPKGLLGRLLGKGD
jgi:curved DNA-binding protein CbpA